MTGNILGFIVSDWGAIDQMIPWGYTQDKKEAALKSIKAGCDMDMMSHSYIGYLKSLVENRLVDENMVNDAVARILNKKFELGLFDDPFIFCDINREKKVLNDLSSQHVALEIAEKSVVLLKNDQQILPLKKDIRKVALIGPLSNSKRNLLGSWTPFHDTTNVVSLLEGLKNKLGKNTQIECIDATTILGTDSSQFSQAIRIAKNADIVVLALGEAFDMSGEARSKANINLPGIQQELFNAIAKTQKPIVTILMAGRPLVIPTIYEKSNAVLYAWWLGDQTGNAFGNILKGNYNSSAKLVMTIPRSIGQLPLTYRIYKTGHPNNNKPGNNYHTGYVDIDNRPQYAFGYGLSYTHFTYSNLQINKQNFNADDSVSLQFQVKNDGQYDGEEIVQLYINDPFASIVQRTIKLKKFKKIFIPKGKTEKLTFNINKKDIGFYDDMGQWKVDDGKINILIGAASDDIRLQQEIEYRL